MFKKQSFLDQQTEPRIDLYTDGEGRGTAFRKLQKFYEFGASASSLRTAFGARLDSLTAPGYN
jgi:hypothetical protein